MMTTQDAVQLASRCRSDHYGHARWEYRLEGGNLALAITCDLSAGIVPLIPAEDAQHFADPLPDGDSNTPWGEVFGRR